MNAVDLLSQTRYYQGPWYRAKHDMVYGNRKGDRLFYVEGGCESGGQDEHGVTWYRISCSFWFGDWIEQNCDTEQWRAHGERHRAIYIVREDLMTFIRLKWL
jgi:hypothetical protein